MKNPVSAETAKSEIRATVSRALATALIGGFYQAEQEGHELTQLQQIDMATMSIMAYDKAIEACESIDLSTKIESGNFTFPSFNLPKPKL